jgi:uncharacterized protein YjbI with pentapeptide repeats
VGANLEGAYLNGANLGGASLDGANLRGADLSDTTGLTQDQLAVASGDAKTVLPRGVARPADWQPAQFSES